MSKNEAEAHHKKPHAEVKHQGDQTEKHSEGEPKHKLASEAAKELSSAGGNKAAEAHAKHKQAGGKHDSGHEHELTIVGAEDGKAALAHVLNYPNPFTTNTYFQFEHNLASQLLDVQVSIFSVSGKLVKTLLHSATADGFRVTDIAWDGKDEYGDVLARGVYLYRVKVRGTDVAGTAVTAESDFEKLVILK